PIVRVGCVLLLLLSGCTPAQRGLRVRNLADDVRPVYQISQMDPDASEESLSLEAKRELADMYLADQRYVQAFRLYEELRSHGVEDAGLHLALAQIWHYWNDQAL